MLLYSIYDPIFYACKVEFVILRSNGRQLELLDLLVYLIISFCIYFPTIQSERLFGMLISWNEPLSQSTLCS